ncbi:NAD(P)-dependent alcohol dehydrogenase [Streptomonospora wellingtoniae]|uniref:NAD(P)-dependent alcohol dehydrogenase n=1 Tax=Streptomonospora wellingtoniae TaxID=3075544 RepID=A0ABU2L1I8_9ACTN|nr:NAD(P)-dependent alcohol dehydrogenase [Streptomonospora sp. DSM 45055]MDT0305203.1 NAD(P)-dependent alcohol dehydrogenase [Streptomonospora sp. DSM 45055]
MRAVSQDRYGTADAVTVEDIPQPVPADDEILVRVRAASLNGSDRENLVGRPYYARLAGLRRPRNPVPGSDVAGVVAAAGDSVTEFAPGDEVFGELAGYRGGLAEYVATPPRLLARKPPGLSFTEAAAIPQAGCIALQATRGLRPGEQVLVNGAGGAGGAFVIGLAKHLGAVVTAVDRADKADHLVRVGADATVACEDEDWSGHRGRYDRVVDLVAHRSPFRVHPALRPGGTYFVVGGHTRVLLATLFAGPPIRWTTGKRAGVLVVPQSRADLEAVTALVTDGAVVPPAADRVYPLEEAPAAFVRLVAGDNRGKIVIAMP